VQSLTKTTAQLPEIPLVKPPSVLGKNTRHSMQSGIVLGYAGMVEYLVKEYAKAMQCEVKVIATGGLSYVMKDVTSIFHDFNEMLTMEGLRIIGEKYLP